jgi:photosystem II stability/assembly factor-like uncharacterized protein
MNDREDDDLGSSLSAYLEGYSTYSRTNQPRPQKRGPVSSIRHNRIVLSSAVAVLAAVVIAIPAGVTLLLRSGGTTSPAGLVQGPAEIADLHMFSSTTGWAWGGGSDIVHTTVGVQQWTLVPPPVGRFNIIEVAWVNSQSARVLASSGSSQNVGTYQLVGWSTDDGGASWRQGQSFSALDETAQSIYSASDLSFVDPMHGWFFDTQDAAEGSPIFIFRTVDGGMHWSRVEMTPARGTAAAGALPVGCVKNGMTFLDSTTGWVVGACIGGGPFFDVTHDAGATWTPQPFDCAAGCSLNAPQFTSPLDGELVAAVGIPVLFATTDGGRSWTQRADLPATFVHFINADVGFALGLTGNDNPTAVLWTTHDRGQSWREAAKTSRSGARGVGPTSDIDQIDFVNANLGWATPVDITAGGSNNIPTPNTAPFTFWETKDAGATWSLVTPRFTRSSTSGNGVVLGALEAVGGPAPGTPRPLRGAITLRDSAGTAFTATAGSDGVFSVRVPTGSYTITGRSPLYDSGNVDCHSIAPAPVTVTAGATIRVVVACQES